MLHWRVFAIWRNLFFRAVLLALIFWLTPAKLGVADGVSYFVLAMR